MGFAADHTICSLRGKDFKFASEENLVSACAELLSSSTRGQSRGRSLIAMENGWNVFAHIPEAVGDISKTIQKPVSTSESYMSHGRKFTSTWRPRGRRWGAHRCVRLLAPVLSATPWPPIPIPIPIPVCAVTWGPESPDVWRRRRGRNRCLPHNGHVSTGPLWLWHICKFTLQDSNKSYLSKQILPFTGSNCWIRWTHKLVNKLTWNFLNLLEL